MKGDAAQLARQTRWYVRNKDYHNTVVRSRYRFLRAEAIKAYGGVCACCGDRHEEFLCLDHINGGGTQQRKTESARNLLGRLRREGYPKGEFRVLCHNCNFSYGLLGYCPHQLDKNPSSVLKCVET